MEKPTRLAKIARLFNGNFLSAKAAQEKKRAFVYKKLIKKRKNPFEKQEFAV